MNDARYQDVSAIDNRLAELENEKQQLLALRNSLLNAQSDRPIQTFTPEQKIAIFRQRFRGREDIFANRWQNQQGRSGYSVACDNEWIAGVCNKPRIKCQECTHRQFSELSEQIIYRHLAGHQVVGLYPLLKDNTCYLLAADFDKGCWQEEVKAMSRACQEFGIPHVIEISRSGNGAHLWIFFETNIPANQARVLGVVLLDKAMETFPNLSFDSYDRLFPNQDFLPEGGFGNLIALPLQKEARLSGRSCFVDSELNAIADQWLYLSQLKTLTQPSVEELIAAISPNTHLLSEQGLADNRPPWEITAKSPPIKLERLPKSITITLANHIYFLMSELPWPLLAGLKRLASFSNPVFFKTQALRFSTHGIPRFISCARIENGYLALSRGCLDEAIALLQEHNISVQFDDKREAGKPLIKLAPTFTLRKNQREAVAAMSKHDFGILHAPTAFGKTVTAIGMIAKRKVNTLILVHSRQLLEQWHERLRTFLPDVNIGSVGGGKRKPSDVIDIATYQSLVNKKDNSISHLIQDYGHIIVDECHHLSAPRFEMVLNEVRAKYVLGLTATPERQDGHQKIIFMAAGPIRYKVKSSTDEQFTQTVIINQFYDAPPHELVKTDERPKVTDAYRWLVDNECRTSKIISDAIQCVHNGGHPLILTERRDHAENIHTQLGDMGINSIVLKGAMKAAERKYADKHLQSAQIVVATGKYVGEGFDLPRLDTLFLAMPIAWKGTLAQYAGRIHREAEGKTQVTIHDYVDCALPMLQRMFKKREKSYKAMGYTLQYVGNDNGNLTTLQLEANLS
ncbi:TOTE conflict system archaeo-eukaryotic primase domain-containing protein [Methylophaga nitratireducenticrescens]|uniref:TOTE conflict system archaeo-eukaryotic primase domain-containing protein n=1 Tax=Methylophaga nitratireducenticrescens TaxID=754476 RepID=UPI000CDBE511|nr:DEAD/DEAH box helicase [Methylophaga nitratireducenticrescens]AUZ85534.1 DNA helicase [Methylophaga nitratireducenticrescens]